MKPFVSNHICLFLLLWLVSPVWADNGVNDYEAYINRYYRLAQEQQKLHKSCTVWHLIRPCTFPAQHEF